MSNITEYKNLFQNKRLSFAERGLLAYILTTSDVTMHDLVKASPSGRDAVYTILKKLEKAGYIQRQQRRNSKGRFGGSGIIVYKNPNAN